MSQEKMYLGEDDYIADPPCCLECVPPAITGLHYVCCNKDCECHAIPPANTKIEEMMSDFRMSFSTGETRTNVFMPDRESHRREKWLRTKLTEEYERGRQEVIGEVEKRT